MGGEGGAGEEGGTGERRGRGEKYAGERAQGGAPPHSRNVASTTPAIRRRASCRGTPLISSRSYGVSLCRTDARTAEATAVPDNARPAALRPTRPLPRSDACAAIANARSAGQRGYSRRISRAKASVNRTSSAARRRASRTRRRRRASASARHRSSASASAASSTSTPCRSYRLFRRLNRTTTADSPLSSRDRRVSAASPRGRNTRCPRSAQSRHRGAPSSHTNSERGPLRHSAQWRRLSG